MEESQLWIQVLVFYMANSLYSVALVSLRNEAQQVSTTQ